MSDSQPPTDDGAQLQKPDNIPGILWGQMPDKAKKMMSVMNAPDGIKQLVMRPVYGSDPNNPTTSQAEIVADYINIFRLDLKRLGEAADIDIEANRMEPERAAELVQELVKGEGSELMVALNDIEDRHEMVLEALTDEETVEAHRETKNSVLYSEIADATSEDDDDE
jgi:hypothetical protein